MKTSLKGLRNKLQSEDVNLSQIAIAAGITYGRLWRFRAYARLNEEEIRKLNSVLGRAEDAHK